MNQILNEPFKYYFITTNNHNSPNFFERDTFAYRFNRNIATHTSSRYVISHLPRDLAELICPWPLSSADCETNYIIEYINIEILMKNKVVIDFIKQSVLGCVFVPEELKQHPIIQEMEGMRIPIIILQEDEEYMSRQLAYIIEKNNVNASQLLNKEIKILDKTKIKPLSNPQKNFLRPLQIAINRNRGLYISTFKNSQKMQLWFVEYENKEVAESEAIRSVKYYLKRLITEKYIMDLVERDNTELIKIIKSRDSSLQIEYLNTEIFEKYFLDLSDYYLEKFDNFIYRIDMCFVLPMVNKISVDMLNKEFHLNLSKRLLKRIYDFSGYYGAEKNTDADKLTPFIYDRALENRILDSLMVHFALGKKNPYVRLPNLPSNDITIWYSHMMKNVILNSNFKEVEKFNTNFHKISEKIKLSFDDEFIEIIVKKGKHIKFITDSPIEWIKYKNVPISLIKSISRLPIIPGNTLTWSAKCNLKIDVEKNDVSFLVVNSLNKSDELYKNGKKLGELLKKYFPNNIVNYYEITNRDDFINVINENIATVFIYYGHASMPEHSRNQSMQVGKLIIGNEEIDTIELAQSINGVPPISILGACQTQVLDSHYLNIGNIFLELGSISVLATFFPVDGDYTFSLIESILRHLKNYFGNSTPKNINNWSEILLQARRTHYILEPIHTIIKYLEKKGDKSQIDIKKLKSFVMKYCIEHVENDTPYYSIMEQAVLHRDKAYITYFDSYPDSTRSLIYRIFKHNYIFPESTLFTSLGSPENINFI